MIPVDDQLMTSYTHYGMSKSKHPMEQWTTQSLSKETARLVEELADVITEQEKRFTRCSKHEAIHKAVAEMITRLKKKR